MLGIHHDLSNTVSMDIFNTTKGAILLLFLPRLENAITGELCGDMGECGSVNSASDHDGESRVAALRKSSSLWTRSWNVRLSMVRLLLNGSSMFGAGRKGGSGRTVAELHGIQSFVWDVLWLKC
jgi:hypothetical protein